MVRKILTRLGLIAVSIVVLHFATAGAVVIVNEPGTYTIGTVTVGSGTCSITLTVTNNDSLREGSDVAVGGLTLSNVEHATGIVTGTTGQLAPGSYDVKVTTATGLFSADVATRVNECPPPPTTLPPATVPVPVPAPPQFTG